MPIYSVQNGYQGYGPVAALVEASDEDNAKELAREAFKQHYPHDEDSWEPRRIRKVTLPYVGDELP